LRHHFWVRADLHVADPRAPTFPPSRATARVEPMIVRRVRTSWPAILIVGGVLIAGCHTTPSVGQTLFVLVSPAPSPGLASVTGKVAPTALTDESADGASTE
jgi:hypothetical protein